MDDMDEFDADTKQQARIYAAASRAIIDRDPKALHTLIPQLNAVNFTCACISDQGLLHQAVKGAGMGSGVKSGFAVLSVLVDEHGAIGQLPAGFQCTWIDIGNVAISLRANRNMPRFKPVVDEMSENVDRMFEWFAPLTPMSHLDDQVERYQQTVMWPVAEMLRTHRDRLAIERGLADRAEQGTGAPLAKKRRM